jgi:hypothetical protein
MNTNAATTQTASHIYGETPRFAISATFRPWAIGATCQALTRTGKACTRTASHITAANQTICSTHAASKYTVDCR